MRKSLPLWVPPLQTEIDNFDNNGAIQRIDEHQTNRILAEAQEKGERAELIPGMGVFTRKAGDGRRRARIVCCGNYMEPRAGDEVYATGADSTQLRAILRVAALHQWECLSLDVKSAFLLAPKAQGETVIVKPPRILEEAGLAKPGEHWLVTSAMYGLVTSPKDWSSFRDAELKKMEGSCEKWDGGKQLFSFRPMEDPNLRAIQEFVTAPDGARQWGEILGHMIVYVDDVLMVGPRKVTDEASATIRRCWSTSAPEYAAMDGSSMRFLGIEIRRLSDGSYFLHQECYAREVLERHPGDGSSQFIKTPDEKEEEEAPSLPMVREAQKVTGELLWLSGKTRPDLSWAVMKMAQNAVKKPRWTLTMGEAVLAYLRSSMNYGLHYTYQVPHDSDPDLMRRVPRRAGTLEVLVDASFSPGDSHSISGTVVLLAGCPIQWESKKQSLMALSTAESELTAILEGLQAGRSARALINLIMPVVDLELYNDNRAAVVLASGSGGGWRTRHLRIRASCLSEALKTGEVSLSHRTGTSLWADGLTKPLPAHHLARFCRGVWLGSPTLGADEVHTKETTLLHSPANAKVLKSISLLATGLAMVPTAAASETCEIRESRDSAESGSWADQGWILILAGLVCILHLVKDLGELVKRFVKKGECAKVTLLDEKAALPVRGTPGAAGWDLAAMELPSGCYGRIAPRSSLAVRGVDVAGGVIDPDFRGEIKIILVNNSSEVFTLRQGDRIGQLILERFSLACLEPTSTLSTTARGVGGFGSTGVGPISLSSSSALGAGGLGGTGVGPTSRLSSSAREAEVSENRIPAVRRLASERPSVEEADGSTDPTSAGPHIFFEGVHFTKGDESLAQLVRRLKENDLRSFRWMFPKNVIDELENSTGRKSPVFLQTDVVQGAINIVMYRHEDWRKKLFDTEVGAPPSTDGITAGVLTIGRLDDGRGFVRVDNRRGNRSMSFLKQSWKGYSLFYSLDAMAHSC